MTPEQAKTKISQLLELGTLQGVRVEYEAGEHCYISKSIDGSLIYQGDYTCAYIKKGNAFQHIKSIHPIPLQPKLLEVGTRVKIIGGVNEGMIGVIEHVNTNGYQIGWLTEEDYSRGYSEELSFYNVVPESLLVEEEKVDATEIAVDAIKKERHKMTDPAVYSILIQEDKDQLNRIEEQLKLLNKQAIK